MNPYAIEPFNKIVCLSKSLSLSYALNGYSLYYICLI